MQNLMFDVHFFRFGPEILFVGNFGPKSQNCQFSLKFGTQTNSNMGNSMLMFISSVLTRNIAFGKIWSLMRNLVPGVI